MAVRGRKQRGTGRCTLSCKPPYRGAISCFLRGGNSAAVAARRVRGASPSSLEIRDRWRSGTRARRVCEVVVLVRLNLTGVHDTAILEHGLGHLVKVSAARTQPPPWVPAY